MQNATQTILSNKRLHLHKNFRKVRLKRKVTKRQTTTTKKQRLHPPSYPILLTQPIFPNDFSQVVYLFLSQKSVKLAQTIYIVE